MNRLAEHKNPMRNAKTLSDRKNDKQHPLCSSYPIAKDALLVLNDLLKNSVVSSDLVPDIISGYTELKSNFDKKLSTVRL